MPRAALALASVVGMGFVVACTSAPNPPPVDVGGGLALAVVAQRAVHTATTLDDGSVMVVGGCVIDGCGTATDSVVDISADGVAMPGPALEQPRAGHVAVRLGDGSVLVASGFTGEGQAPQTSAELRAPGQTAWSSVGSLQLGRGGAATAVLGDGRVLVAGGWLGPRTYTATTEIFDPDARTFSPGPDLVVAADGLAAATLADGSVIVAGGQVRPEVGAAAATVVSADGTTATEVGSMQQARFKHTMVPLPDGRVLVIGGTADDTNLLRSTEIYDPVTRTFSSGPTMVSGRYKLDGSAVVLPDGRVLVAGGGDGVEVIDVRAGTSVVIPGATSGRASFSTANRLGDDVLVLGGYDERIRLTGLDLVITATDLART